MKNIEILEKINEDTKIHRYMDLSKFLDLIENGLFLSRMDNFDDKLEGGLTTLNSFIDTGGAAALDNLMNNVLPQSFGRTMNPPEEIEEAKDRENKYKESLENQTTSTVFGDISLTEKITYKKVISKQKHWLDVSCWYSGSKNNESIAMWKIYGGNSNSICISTTIGKLLNSLKKYDDLIVAKVEYIDHKEDQYKSNHLIAPFIHKHQAYDFENEVRFIAFKKANDPMSYRSEVGTLIPLTSTSFIDEVKVSPEAQPWFFKLIDKLVKERYKLGAKVTRSELDELVSELGH